MFSCPEHGVIPDDFLFAHGEKKSIRDPVNDSAIKPDEKKSPDAGQNSQPISMLEPFSGKPSLYRIRFFFCIGLLFSFFLLPSTAAAQADPFNQWLEQFAQEAVAVGISPVTVQNALGGLVLDESVLELDQKQPERTITFASYSHNLLKPDRIEKGRRYMAEYRTLLKTIEAQYGVPPRIVIALWSVESSFGRNTGGYNVIESLATLAFAGRRQAFFRNELLEALRIVDEERMDPSAMNGSWAGAMGQSQFMPSTYRRHAVDHDGDGHRDIWENERDVFASMANYLAAEGWQRSLTWGREVRLTNPLLESETGLDRRRTLAEWNRLGVRTPGGKPLPKKKIEASLIQPDGPGGRSFLVYDNFRALMRWNRSTYFAATVGLLADKLR